MSALLLKKVSAVLGFFAQGVGIFSTPIKVRGLLAFETTSLVVVIVLTWVCPSGTHGLVPGLAHYGGG
jgi:hypothetical protein